MEITDKENDQAVGVDTNGAAPRTPLSEVSNSKNSQNSTPMFLKHGQYSQVTPFSTPLSHTPKRPVSRIHPSSTSVTQAADIPLNSLIYQKVVGIITEKEQEFKNVLDEKDSVISELQQKLQLLTLPQVKNNPEDEPNSSSALTDSPPLDTTITTTQPRPTTNTSLDISGIKEIFSSYGLTCEDENMSFDILPLLDSAGSLELASLDIATPDFDKSVSNEPTTQTSEPYQPKTLDFSAVTTPKSYRDVSVSTTPCNLDIKAVDGSEITETVDLIDTGVGASYVSTTDVQTWTTPTKFNTVSQNTTPEVMASQGTMAFPVQCATVAMNTEDKEVCTVGTATEERSVMDSATIMTPSKCTSTSAGTDPTDDLSQETFSTPQPKKQDVAVGTSPFCHTIPRPSEINYSSLKVKDITEQLEIAAISNTLLRDELSAAQQEKVSISKKVTNTNSKLKEFEEENEKRQEETERRIHQVRLEANEQLQNLMEEQAQYLSQISQLQCELKKRDSQIEDTQKLHEKRVEVLNGELADLKADLLTAYRQKKQQIEAVKAEYTATDYRPHYERARQEIAELKAQLDTFTGLHEDIVENKVILQETSELVWKKAKEVKEAMAVSEELKEEHQKWEKQHEEWAAEMSKNPASLSEVTTELESCQKKIQHIERDLKESQEAREELQASLKAAEDQAKVNFVEAEGLMVTLQMLEGEKTKSQETIASLSSELDSFKKERDDMSKDKTSQSEQLSKMTQECERYKRFSEMQRNSLSVVRKDLESIKKQHQKLKDESDALKSEVIEKQSLVESLNGEIMQLKTEMSLLQTELESIHSQYQEESEVKSEEVKACRMGVRKISQLVVQIQSHLTTCRAGWIDGVEQEVTTEDKPASEVNPKLQLSKIETDRRKSSRKSIICSVMNALSGGVESPTVDPNTAPPLMAEIPEVPAETERETEGQQNDLEEVEGGSQQNDQEGVEGGSQQNDQEGVEGGNLLNDLHEMEGSIKDILEYVTGLTSEVYHVMDTLKSQVSSSGATSKELGDMIAERDEAVRQLQRTRSSEVEHHTGQQVLNWNTTDDTAAKKIVQLEETIEAYKLKLEMLESKYEKALSHFRATGILTMEDLEIAKENLSLSMEVTELRHTVSKQETLITRYGNHKRKLQFNWQTAENELAKLVQLIETVRQVLCEHETEIRASWREVRRLDRLGMFDPPETQGVKPAL